MLPFPTPLHVLESQREAETPYTAESALYIRKVAMSQPEKLHFSSFLLCFVSPRPYPSSRQQDPGVWCLSPERPHPQPAQSHLPRQEVKNNPKVEKKNAFGSWEYKAWRRWTGCES